MRNRGGEHSSSHQSVQSSRGPASRETSRPDKWRRGEGVQGTGPKKLRTGEVENRRRHAKPESERERERSQRKPE